MGYAVPDWANPKAIPDIYTTDAQRKLWQKRQRETQDERREAAIQRWKDDPKRKDGVAIKAEDYRLTDAELQSLLPKPPPKPKEPTPTVPQESLKISNAGATPDAGPSTDTGPDSDGGSGGGGGGGGGGTDQQTTTDDLKIDTSKKATPDKKKKKPPKKDAGNPSDTGGGGGAGETNL